MLQQQKRTPFRGSKISKRGLTSKYREVSSEIHYLASPPSDWVILTPHQNSLSIKSYPIENKINVSEDEGRFNSLDNFLADNSDSNRSVVAGSINNLNSTTNFLTATATASSLAISTDAAAMITSPSYSTSPTSSILLSPFPQQQSRKTFATNKSNQYADGSTKLHELCSSTNPSLEMIRMFISTFPWSLKQKNSKGEVPLHCAIKIDEPIQMVVCELLKSFPEAAQIRDKNNDLPLFIAVRRGKVSPGVLRALLHAYPMAASTKCYGSYALHHLVQQGSALPESIKVLLAAFPQAAHLPNAYGNLPLHFLCATQMTNSYHQMEATRLLMKGNPRSITYINKSGETPFERALNLAENGQKEEMRERIRLLLKLSDSAFLSDEQKVLLRNLNWEARKVIILVCVKLAEHVCPKDRGLLHMYLACDGVYRHIIAFL